MSLLDQPGAVPPRPDFLKDIQSSEIVGGQRKLTFSTDNVGGPSEHTINGKKFGEGHSWKVDKLNVVEEWKIINTTNPENGAIDHPFRIHINPFQVTAVFDPNQKLLNAVYEPVKDTDGNVLGVYVFSTTQPQPGSLRPGQCWVNPNDETTWIPCPQPDQPKTNIWWDVFPIPGARVDTATNKLVPGYFVLRSRFVDYRGAYVMHCAASADNRQRLGEKYRSRWQNVRQALAVLAERQRSQVGTTAHRMSKAT